MSAQSPAQSPHPSTTVSSHHQGVSSSSMTTSSSIPTTTSSRRGKPPPPKGMALGLEEEVDFGSDEDLMETVGEIALPAQGWYPGRPDSPPRNKKDKGKAKQFSSGISSSFMNGKASAKPDTAKKSSRPSIMGMGKMRPDKSKGLNDARVVMSPELANAVDESLGHRRQASDQTSSHSGSGLTGTASQTSLKRDKKSGMFGRMFGGKGKKEDEKPVVGITPQKNVSVSSFGSYTRSEASSQQRSILITPAHLPPTHAPGRSEASIPGLPNVNTSPFSYDLGRALPRSRSGLSHEQHDRQNSLSADVPLISAGAKPGTVSSEGRSDSVSLESPSPAPHPGLFPSDSDSSFGKSTKDALRLSSGSSVKRPSVISTNSSQLPSVVESTDLVHFLIPPFPTLLPNLESTTILSTTVMRRMPLGSSFGANGGTPDSKKGLSLRSSTGAALSSFGSQKFKPIWQTHQLVLTSFQINEPTPHPSPGPHFAHSEGEGHGQERERRLSTTQTVAHLHLFAVNAPNKGSRPKTGFFGEGNKVEVERSRIGPDTSAGVWEGTDAGEGGHEGDKEGRRCVLRVRFDTRDIEEWLCDMPSAETLFEWIKQIKGYSTVIKAESLGYGSALRDAHASGSDKDLALELEMHTRGLRSTPTRSRISNPPMTPTPMNDPFLVSPGSPEYRSRMSSPGQDFDSPFSHLAKKSSDGVDPLDVGVTGLAISKGELGNNAATENMSESRRGSTIDAIESQALSQRRQSISRAYRTNLPPRPPVPSGLPPPLPPPAGLPPPAPTVDGPPVSTLASSLSPSEPSPTLGQSDELSIAPAAAPDVHGSQARLAIPSQLADSAKPRLTEEWRETLSTVGKPLSLAPEMSASPPLSQHSSPRHSGLSASTPIQTASTAPVGLAISGSSLGPETPSEGGFYTPSEDIAGIGQLRAKDSRELLRPAVQRHESDRIETASIASSAGGSSVGRRRQRLKTPAVDLMAELSARPEMNFEKSGRMDDDTPIDESRPRRIRFAG